MKKTLACIFCLHLLKAPLLAAAVVFGVVPQPVASSQGVAVARVVGGTPAAAAGLQAGDIITHVQGVPTPDAAALRSALSAYAPGDVVRVFYVRAGAKCVALAELVSHPGVSDAKVADNEAAETPELSPELLQQFAQVRSRLRSQLARLPYRMNRQQVLADMQELTVLARTVPSRHADWLCGSSVETALELEDAGGCVVLRLVEERLQLELHSGSSVRTYPLESRAQCEALPADVVHRLQSL